MLFAPPREPGQRSSTRAYLYVYRRVHARAVDVGINRRRSSLPAGRVDRGSAWTIGQASPHVYFILFAHFSKRGRGEGLWAVHRGPSRTPTRFAGCVCSDARPESDGSRVVDEATMDDEACLFHLVLFPAPVGRVGTGETCVSNARRYVRVRARGALARNFPESSLYLSGRRPRGPGGRGRTRKNINGPARVGPSIRLLLIV